MARVIERAAILASFCCFFLHTPLSAAPIWRGVDLSYVNEMEDCGAVYRFNGAEVELFINGESQGRRTSDRDRMSERLRHPPSTFTTLRFQPGVLEAIAYDSDGIPIARDTRGTPGSIAGIEAVLATQGVEPAVADVLFVHARLVDAAGQTVPETGRRVQFQVGTGLTMIGPGESITENGLAATLVKVLDPSADLEVGAVAVERWHRTPCNIRTAGPKIAPSVGPVTGPPGL